MMSRFFSYPIPPSFLPYVMSHFPSFFPIETRLGSIQVSYTLSMFPYPSLPPSFLPYPSFPPREIHSGSPTGTFLRPSTRVCPAGRPPPVLPGPLMGEERSGWLHSPGASALCHISDGEHTLWATLRHRPRGQRSNCTSLYCW